MNSPKMRTRLGNWFMRQSNSTACIGLCEEEGAEMVFLTKLLTVTVTASKSERVKGIRKQECALFTKSPTFPAELGVERWKPCILLEQKKLWLYMLREQCLFASSPTEHSSIDEKMLPFHGKFRKIKQFIRGKPHHWGFKYGLEPRALVSCKILSCTRGKLKNLHHPAPSSSPVTSTSSNIDPTGFRESSPHKRR